MSASWHQSTLGESCEMYQPKTIAKRELIADGKYPVYGANGVIGRYDTYNHSEAQLLLTCRGATCGSVNISSGKCWVTGNAMVIRPRTSDIDLQYLAYYFMGGVDLSSVISGSAQPQITRKSLNPVLLRYPPKAEQERIVEILNQAIYAIDTATENTQKNLANTEELFQNHLHQVFELAKKSPESWVQTTLGQVCDMYQPKSISKRHFVPDGLYPVYGANGIIGQYDQYNHSDIQLLITCRGATCGAINQTNGKCWVNGNAMVVKPQYSAINRDYLAYYFKGAVNLSSFVTGAAQPQLTRTSLRSIPLRYPDLERQKTMVKEFEKVRVETDAIRSVYRMKLRELSALRASVLKKAFTGRLINPAQLPVKA